MLHQFTILLIPLLLHTVLPKSVLPNSLFVELRIENLQPRNVFVAACLRCVRCADSGWILPWVCLSKIFSAKIKDSD